MTQERASLTLNVKRGAALWLGGRLVARIAAGIEHSRITPDDPVPQWRKDAMTFVDGVNAKLDEERLARAMRSDEEVFRLLWPDENGIDLAAERLAARYNEATE